MILVYPRAPSDKPSGGMRLGGTWGHEKPGRVPRILPVYEKRGSGLRNRNFPMLRML